MGDRGGRDYFSRKGTMPKNTEAAGGVSGHMVKSCMFVTSEVSGELSAKNSSLSRFLICLYFGSGTLCRCFLINREGEAEE